MQTYYNDWTYKGSDPVARTAEELFRLRRKPCRLAPLVLMTDPKRLPEDPIAAARRLPPGSAIIYRHFGRDDAHEIGKDLRQITFLRDQQLLIGDDPEMATELGADGVHFRRDRLLTAPTLWRQLCPDWIISMAGIKRGAYSGDLKVLDALIISSVFDSNSPSAGTATGTEAFTRIADDLKNYDLGVFALGGVNSKTVRGLIGTGAAGIAGVTGILPKEGHMAELSISKNMHGDGIQFVARVEGMDETGVLDLKKSGDNLYTATHTGVPRSMGGKGVGSALVKALMEDARENSYKIIPACSFVDAKFKRHKEWADLKA